MAKKRKPKKRNKISLKSITKQCHKNCYVTAKIDIT